MIDFFMQGKIVTSIVKSHPMKGIQKWIRSEEKGHHFTPPKFNMEPEKKSLEKEIPFGNHHFQVPC